MNADDHSPVNVSNSNSVYENLLRICEEMDATLQEIHSPEVVGDPADIFRDVDIEQYLRFEIGELISKNTPTPDVAKDVHLQNPPRGPQLDDFPERNFVTSGEDAASIEVRGNDALVGDTIECQDTPVTGVGKNDAFVRENSVESLDDDTRSHDPQQGSVLRVNAPQDRLTEASELTNRDGSRLEDLFADSSCAHKRKRKLGQNEQPLSTSHTLSKRLPKLTTPNCMPSTSLTTDSAKSVSIAKPVICQATEIPALSMRLRDRHRGYQKQQRASFPSIINKMAERRSSVEFAFLPTAPKREPQESVRRTVGTPGSSTMAADGSSPNINRRENKGTKTPGKLLGQKSTHILRRSPRCGRAKKHKSSF